MSHATGYVGYVRRGAAAAERERGSGLMGTCFGIMFFLGFLLLAAQITLGLYARSVVTSAALDSGRIMAGAAGPNGMVEPGELATAQAEAVNRVRSLLGPHATFELRSVDRAASVVEVAVSAPRPRLLWGGGTLGSDVIERRVRVRLEQLQ